MCTCSGDLIATALVALSDETGNALDSEALPEPIPALEEFGSDKRFILTGCLGGEVCIPEGMFRQEFAIDTLTVPEPAVSTLGAAAIASLSFLRRRPRRRRIRMTDQ